MATDIIARMQAAIPRVRQWIEDYKRANERQSVTVSSLRFKRIPECFSDDLLVRARVAAVPRVPFPPLDQFDLPEFAPMQKASFAGITFDDTFYILEAGSSEESLHFHELVHVVQWGRLGMDDFLLAYGIGLIQHGYEQSPLESMAYRLQAEFERGIWPPRLAETIESETALIWNDVSKFLRGR